MSAYDERYLRRLFRRMVWVVAATSGCGASVTVSASDAAVDRPAPVDVPPIVDVPPTVAVPRVIDGPPVVDGPPGVDVPLAVDGAPTSDLGRCEPVRTPIGSGDSCPGETVRFPCGFPAELQGDAGGAVASALCTAHCRLNDDRFGPPYCYRSVASGVDTLHCQTPCPGGRRPEGFVDATTNEPESPGRWFARLAALESASVSAFERMVDELTLHRAPDDLIERARAAIVDERRHTALTTDLARTFGGDPSLSAAESMSPRSLDAVALDNAVEGCVRETYGALVATWQAAHARDPRVAAAMEAIAEDETRHAALSWALHAWSRERLDADERAAVARALRDAVSDLRRELDGDVGDELVAVTGMPDRGQQGALLDALASSLVGLA